MRELSFDEKLGDDLVDRARSLRPLLERTAAQSEERGELVPEVVSAITDAGFLKIAVPRRWGGLSVSCNAITRLTAELAKACPSTAWLTSVMNTAVWRHTVLSDESQEDMFCDGIPLFCGVGTQPGQKARAVDGGFLIENGAWGYASGSHHADYFHGLISIEGDEASERLAIIPMSDMTIEHTWKVAGMRATGSDTVVAKDVFVPTHRAVKSEKQFEPSPDRVKHFGDVTDYWSAMPYIRTKIMGTLLGTVEGVLDYVASTKDRPILYTNFRQKGGSGVFNERVGRAAAIALGVRNMLDGITRAIDDAACARRPMRRSERALNRGQLALCVDLLNQAMDILMNAGGSSAFQEKNPSERLWRDFNVASRHAMLIPEIGFEVYGRSFLGVEQIAAPEFL